MEQDVRPFALEVPDQGRRRLVDEVEGGEEGEEHEEGEQHDDVAGAAGAARQRGGVPEEANGGAWHGRGKGGMVCIMIMWMGEGGGEAWDSFWGVLLSGEGRMVSMASLALRRYR